MTCPLVRPADRRRPRLGRLSILLLALLLSGGAAAPAQDAVYFVARPQDAPGDFADGNEGRLVRLDPGTGLFDTVSGVVEASHPIPLAAPRFSAVYREEGGPLFLFFPATPTDPRVRLVEVPVGGTAPIVRFSAIPPLDGLRFDELLRISDTSWLCIGRSTNILNLNDLTSWGDVYGNDCIALLDLESQSIDLHERIVTSAVSVDLATKSCLTLSQDLQRIERYYWETRTHELVTTADYSGLSLVFRDPTVVEFSVNSHNQTAEAIVIGTKPTNYNPTNGQYNRLIRKYEYDFAGATTAAADVSLDVYHFGYVVRVFGEFVTRQQTGAYNYSTDRELPAQSLPGSDGLHSTVGRSFYHYSPQVHRAGGDVYYWEIVANTFNADYTSSFEEHLRIDFPTVRPAVVRGSGPPIEVPFHGTAQVLPGTVAGTVNILHPGGLLRVDLATGDRTTIATFPLGFNYRGGGAALFTNVAAVGTAGRPPEPFAYINHLVNITLFDGNTVEPDRNYDGDVNSADLVRRENELEVLP